jgi:hypothetical protein
MSDTITVTAPRPGPNAGIAPTFSPNPNPMVQPSMVMALTVNSIISGNAFYESCAWAAQKAKDNNFDAVLNWLTQSTYFDNCFTDSKYTVADYFHNPEIRRNWQLNDMNAKLSGTPWSVPAAMANYLFGNGRPMDMDINAIGLKINQSNITGFQEKIAAFGQPGVYPLSHNFAYNTMNDNVSSGLILGNVTLKIEGNFTRSNSGQWQFNGVIRGFQDTYDFNKSNHRSDSAEQLTTIGRYLGEKFSGTQYPININGEIPIVLHQ